jgi:hypothetical protein
MKASAWRRSSSAIIGGLLRYRISPRTIYVIGRIGEMGGAGLEEGQGT